MKKFMGTPYPWRWFTSNSHARLSSEVTGKDGDVIHAYKAYDGMACVNVRQRDMAVIAAAPELLEALISVMSMFPVIDDDDSGRLGFTVEARKKLINANLAIAKALGEKS